MKELSPWRIRRMAQPQDIQPEYGYVPQEDEVHLSHYWNILVKHRLVILVLFFIGAAIGAYFPSKATQLYTASAMLRIEPQHPQVTGVTALEPLVAGMDYYPTQFALLRSRRLAAMVISDLNLESNKTFTDAQIVSPNPLDHIKSWMFRTLGTFSYYVRWLFPTPPSPVPEASTPVTLPVQPDIELNVSSHLINQYLGFINIAPVEKTRLVTIQFTTPDPTLSQALANAHVEAFLRMTLESRFNLTKEAREFLDQKIIELRGKLEKSEAVLNTFRRTHGVISVEKGENIIVDRLLDLNRQLTAARAQRIEAEALYRTVENKTYQDLAEVMRQGLVMQLKGNVATLEAEKARVSTIFKPDHPRIQELNQQIGAARQALNNEIADVVRGIRSNYTAALAKERGLQAEADAQQHVALRVKELGVEFTVLQGEVNANRALYESVLKRLSETNVANDIAVSNVQIAERADTPRGPSGPNSSRYLLASMISGLFFGVGFAFVREYFNSTVATPEDVRRSVGLSTLGVVPHFKFLDRGKHNHAQIDPPSSGRQLPAAQAAAKQLITNHSPLSIVSESYRTIRTSLLLSQADKPPQVVLLTSPAPGEGKTLTALNLGIALAQDGYSVLIIDGDMRKGSCHARMGLRNNRGLSNVLTGGLLLEEGIQATSINGLSLLSRGVLPPNPTELLGSSKMREVLHELRKAFRFIVIDSPPVIAVSDASVLSVISDGVLLVFDGQNTSTPSAQKAVERLDMVRARLLGVVLNGINLKDPQYSYYRTYSSYYSYQSPSEEEAPGGNGNNSDEPGYKFDWLSGMNQLGGKRRNRKPMDTTKDATDTSGGYRQDGRDDWGSIAGVETPGEWQAADSDSAPPNVMRESISSEDSKEVTAASQGSLQRIIEALTEAIGPIAALVVQEQIAVLGESRHAFPESQIDELVKLIHGELTESERQAFLSHYRKV